MMTTEEQMKFISLYESDDPVFWEEYNQWLHSHVNEEKADYEVENVNI